MKVVNKDENNVRGSVNTSNKRKQVTFDVDLETHLRVKICAAKLDQTMNLFIHIAILKALRELEIL